MSKNNIANQEESILQGNVKEFLTYHPVTKWLKEQF